MNQIRLKWGLLAFLCVYFLQAPLLLSSLLLLEGLCSLVQLFEGGSLPAIRCQELSALAQLRTGCLALLVCSVLVLPDLPLPLSPLPDLFLIVSLHEAIDLCLFCPFLGESR